MSEAGTHIDETNAVDQADPVLQSVAIHVLGVFHNSMEHRRRAGIDKKLANCQRLARAEYSMEDKQLFREKGAPEIFMPIADMKRRAALSMFVEIFATPGDKAYTVNPSPVPEVPPEVTEKALTTTMNDFVEYASATGIVPSPEVAFVYAQDRMDEILNEEESWAKVRAELMENEVHDKMVEGFWLDAFAQYSQFLCTYGTAVIKGPIPRLVYKTKSKRTKAGTKFVMEPQISLTYEAVSPWDCFPSKGARKIDQGDFCVRVKYTPVDFSLFAQRKGKEWHPDVINDILQRHPTGGIVLDVPGENLRRTGENSTPDLYDQCVIEGIDFYGDIRGSSLEELGFRKDTDGNKLDSTQYYEVNAIVVDNKVIYCKIIEPQIGRNLSKGTFYCMPDSWWGDSVLEKCESTQRLCNAAVRDLVVNMAQCSGPQTIIKDIARLHPTCSAAQSPWKVWLFETSVMGDNGDPLKIFQPQSNIRELLAVFDWGMKQADNDTGIPAYAYGAAMAGGAGRTASGLEMMLENVNRGMKMVVMETDREVQRTTVMRTVKWLMLYGDKEHIKGDYEVNPSGVMSLIFREGGSVRRRAFLQLLANPLVAQAVLPSGIAAIIREEARTLDINPDDIVPSRERLQELDEMAVIQRQMQLAASMAEAQSGTGGGSGMLPYGQQQAQQQAQPQMGAQIPTDAQPAPHRPGGRGVDPNNVTSVELPQGIPGGQ